MFTINSVTFPISIIAQTPSIPILESSFPNLSVTINLNGISLYAVVSL